MKTIFTIFSFLLCVGVSGQDSCYKKTVDQFDQSIEYASLLPIPLDKGADVSIKAGGQTNYYKGLYLFFHTNTTMSVDEKSYCIVLFSDGTKHEYIAHIGGYNLSGTFMFCYFKNGMGGFKKRLKELLEKNIKAIRLVGFSETVDIDISPEKADELRSAFNCVYNAWDSKK